MLNDPNPASHRPHTHWVALAGRCEPLAPARDRVRTLLAGVVPCVDDAVLVVSELVGDAVRHTTAGPDCLTIEIDEDQVIVAVPSSETRTRKAIDDAFTEEAEEEDEGDRPGAQGTSVPRAKSMCPQCALAA